MRNDGNSVVGKDYRALNCLEVLLAYFGRDSLPTEGQMTTPQERLQARLRTLGEEKSKFTKADLEAYASNMNIEMTRLEGKYLAVELLAHALTEQDVRDIQEVIARLNWLPADQSCICSGCNAAYPEPHAVECPEAQE